ncbi:nuclear transport factor 2 family protein [Oscillatoria amoena NRMC-F 0135]|nr:nuclear transport factor 2 family protein [Oscillatoria amoena NRMC-F 0135]
MHVKLPLFLLFIPLIASSQAETEKESIRLVMREQQDAWNRADVNTFMEGYWKSDSLKFIGSSGVTYGWQTALNNYKKRYPTKEAMGHLTFTILSLEMLTPESAFLVGKWHLKRANDEPGGYFTLVWRKINGKWVIVVDHTS